MEDDESASLLGTNDSSSEKKNLYDDVLLTNEEIDAIRKSVTGNSLLGDCIGDSIDNDDPTPIIDATSCHFGSTNVTSLETVQLSFATYHARPFLGTRRRDAEGIMGDYKWETYGEVLDKFISFASGLQYQYNTERSLSIAKPGDFVAICSPNRAEWVVSDLACVWLSMISVPIHFETDQSSLEYIVNHSDSSCAVCDAPNVSKMDDIGDAVKITAEEKGIKLVSFNEVVRQGQLDTRPAVSRKPEDIHTIVYTSGSTGVPKGALMTEKRFNSFICSPVWMPNPLVHISYAPLAHVMERQHVGMILTFGGRLGFYQGDIANIFDDVQLLKPTFFSGPPRLFNLIYHQYQQGLALGMKSIDMTDWITYETDDGVPYYYNKITEEVSWEGPVEQLTLMLMSKLKNVLGGRTQYIVTGGAMTGEAVLEFMRKLFPCPIYNGYGTTETGGISNNDIINHGVDVILEDVPDMGYTSESKPYPAGELCVRTAVMVNGYYKDQKTTSESFTKDGYFRTGDIGARYPDGKVHIIDRKKSIVKLAQGEFVAPERLENILVVSDYVSQIFVHAEPLRSFVIAVVVPNLEAVNEWAKEQGIEERGNSLCSNDRVKKMILEDLNLVGSRNELKPYEIPKNIHLTSTVFTSENGLTTPSMKQRRPALIKHFKNELDNMWHQLDQNQQEITKIITQTLGVKDDIDTAMGMDQLGTDSLSTVRLFSVLKDAFNKEVPLQVLSSGSISEIASYLFSSATAKPLPEQFHEDLKIPIDSTNWHDLPSQSRLETVLLTGVTGFLGLYLLEELLRQSSCFVYCLVRAQDEQTAWKKIEQLWIDSGINVQETWRKRIGIVLGDLSKPRLGLHSEEFTKLSVHVDAIYHCGAQVNWVLPYSQLRLANVVGTVEIVQLATQSKLKPIHCILPSVIVHLHRKDISTLGIAGETEGSFVSDAYLPTLNAYSLTKYAAERYLERSSHEGLPVAVYRPGMITGSSTTGYSNPTDFVNRILRGMAQMKSFPESNKLIDMTPVDHVAKVIIGVSLQDCFGKTFHIRKSDPVSYIQIGEALSSFGFKDIISEPYLAWRTKIDSSNALFELLPYFPENEYYLSSSTKAKETNVLDVFLQKANMSDVLFKDVPESLLHLCIRKSTLCRVCLRKRYTIPCTTRFYPIQQLR